MLLSVSVISFKIIKRYIEIFRTSLSEMEYYATNSNFIKLNKIFKEAMNGSSSFTPSSSNSSYSLKRPSPYSKPQSKSNRGIYSATNNNNVASNPIPSLLDNIINNGGGNNNNGLPSLFDFRFDSQKPIKQQNIEDNDYSGGQSVIKMRGLPYSVNVNDIKEFFKPLAPSNINLLFGDDGRLSGEAEVEFATPEETNSALEYDRKYIGSRYIELFLHSSSNDFTPSTNNNYTRNNNNNNNSNSTYRLNNMNNNNNNNNDRSPSIPSLFNQIAMFSTQQFMNQNFSNNNQYNNDYDSNAYNNQNNRRQFNNRRGGGLLRECFHL